MSRTVVLWIMLGILMAGLVVRTSMQNRQAEEQLSELQQEIISEQERIRVLTAEWHTLKSPERLEALASRHLKDYIPLKPNQLATLADVPDRLTILDTPQDVASAAPVAVAAPLPPAPAKAITSDAPVQVAAAKPPVAAQPAPVRVAPVARATPPVTTPRPSRTEKGEESVASLIDRSEGSEPTPTAGDEDDDGIRILIERTSRQDGVILASMGQ